MRGGPVKLDLRYTSKAAQLYPSKAVGWKSDRYKVNLAMMRRHKRGTRGFYVALTEDGHRKSFHNPGAQALIFRIHILRRTVPVLRFRC